MDCQIYASEAEPPIVNQQKLHISTQPRPNEPTLVRELIDYRNIAFLMGDNTFFGVIKSLFISYLIVK